MPPKKRDRDNDNNKSRPTDQYQADHELFLNAFEKPTQIYRFLRTRNMISPIFLNRTLTYMRQRMSRDHKARKNFKVNSLLARLKEKCQKNEIDSDKRYMTLTFLGYYDKTLSSHPEFVKVETSVNKISHKKRKDSSSPLVKLFVGTSEVPVNPSEDHPPSTAPVVSIPSDSFDQSNGNLIKSYVLYLKVTFSDSNHHIATNEDSDSLEPSAKRSKTIPKEDTKYYGSELTVYDKHNRCLLMTGDYELGLQEIQNVSKTSPKKNSQWVTMESTEDEAFEIFSKGPMIKFRLDWSAEKCNGVVDRPKAFRSNGQGVDATGNKENRPDKTVATTGKGKNKNEPQRLQIVYQFLYNNNSRQQTEACDDLICPWCSLNCITLYSLLKHLKLCHSRFTFTYNQIPQGARIDVAINECYDGSYTGSPHDLISQPPGFAFSRNGPVRRTSVTNILVCRPKRPRPSLSEFLELEENDFDGQRPYITGHNRLYHHTTTCLPVYPKEMDIDSEGENDPKWLQQKTIMMIDDFTDVNEGEKELMKLWNLHVMKHGYVGDCQIPLACMMFLKAKGEELLRKNLYRNFVLHVCNLFDFGLISSSTLYMIIRQVHECIKSDPEAVRIIKETWLDQRENWLASGGQGGLQDKAGSNFVFYNPKPEQNNPKMTSSSTFISGDGTLRRKMTQQTPNSKQNKQMRNGKENSRRNSKNASNSTIEEDEKSSDGEGGKKKEGSDVGLRKESSDEKKEDDEEKNESDSGKKNLRKKENAVNGTDKNKDEDDSDGEVKKKLSEGQKKRSLAPPRKSADDMKDEDGKLTEKKKNVSGKKEDEEESDPEGKKKSTGDVIKKKIGHPAPPTRKLSMQAIGSEKTSDISVRRKSASNVDPKLGNVNSTSSLLQFRRKSTTPENSHNPPVS